jgi:hypothetical protein
MGIFGNDLGDFVNHLFYPDDVSTACEYLLKKDISL